MSVQLSKTLSYVLRHGAVEENIAIRSDGFVKIDTLLLHPLFTGYSREEVHHVVSTNSKKRFEISVEEDGTEWIRASQGHSIKLEGMEFEAITDASLFPVVIHGTYQEVLPLIKAQGLKRMARVHIHFASALPEDGVISGMRGSADVVVRVDMGKAMQDGIKFFVSKNGVILTEGVDGLLPPQYFLSVTDRRGDSL